MARLRWKATGAHLEGAEPALLPFLSHRSRPPIKAEPPLYPSPSPARCREPPPPVNPPLSSANAVAKATRSTAELPRARWYFPIRVLALFCPDTSSPARLFSLQFTAAVDDPLWSSPGCRNHLQKPHGEHLHPSMPLDGQMAP